MTYSSVWVPYAEAQEIIDLGHQRVEARRIADTEEHVNNVILRHQNSTWACLFRFFQRPMTREKALEIVRDERSDYDPYPYRVHRLRQLQEHLDVHKALEPQSLLEFSQEDLDFLSPTIKAWREAKAADKAEVPVVPVAAVDEATPESWSLWKHIDYPEDTFQIITQGLDYTDGEKLVAYQNTRTKAVWVCPRSQFIGGQFKPATWA